MMNERVKTVFHRYIDSTVCSYKEGKNGRRGKIKGKQRRKQEKQKRKQEKKKRKQEKKKKKRAWMMNEE